MGHIAAARHRRVSLSLRTIALALITSPPRSRTLVAAVAAVAAVALRYTPRLTSPRLASSRLALPC